MKLFQTIQRGLSLLKVGKAVRELRKETDEDRRARAKHYLIELLGNSQGLPAKVAQFLTMDGDDLEFRETLNDSIPAVPFDIVASILEQAYQAPYTTIFKSLDQGGRTASLGQVHFGKLKDGRKVAVKVQYPHIAQNVEAELNLLGFLPKVGPVAKWGFDMKGYRDVFWNKFGEELDYTQEAAHQKRYRDTVFLLPEIVVPEIIPEYCCSNILVQALEKGSSLDEAEAFSVSERQSLGKALVRHYINGIFNHGFVHSDPHPGNFAFRVQGSQPQVIIYDYGSVLELSRELRLTLLRIILAIRSREPIDPAACLMALGFDVNKLMDLRPFLPALLDLLFEPFLCDGPYDVKTWQMSERVEGMAGDLKWWFRSAAPPILIYLMRTLHGLVSMLKRLEAKPSWKFTLDNLCSGLYEEARNLKIPDLPPGIGEGPGFHALSQYLKVNVEKANGNKVRLTMPARAADDLEGIIDPPVKETIKNQGLNLAEIQRKVRKSAFQPQTIFEVSDSEREVKVWLE